MQKVKMLFSYGPLKRGNVYSVVEDFGQHMLVKCNGKRIYVFSNLTEGYFDDIIDENGNEYLPSFEEVIEKEMEWLGLPQPKIRQPRRNFKNVW